MKTKKSTAKKPEAKTEKAESKAIKLETAVAYAYKLAKHVKEVTAALEEAKAKIRELALPMIAEGQNNVKIETSLGICTVALVKDQLGLIEGMDAEVLQYTVPDDLWNTFFVMKPVLRSTAHAAWMSLPEDRKIAMGDPCPFKLNPRQAQVTLPK